MAMSLAHGNAHFVYTADKPFRAILTFELDGGMGNPELFRQKAVNILDDLPGAAHEHVVN